MWKDKSSIQTKFLNKMTYVVFISIGLWCFVWIQGEYSTFKSESDSFRSAYIQSQKGHLKNEVESVIQNINTVRLQAEKKLEIFLKERVDEAFSTAMYIYQQNVDSKSLPEIEKMIKDALRPVRFNDGRGYYFAVSLDGVEQLYPVNPESEGKNLIGLQDSKGSFVIQNEIDVIKRKGEGFIKDSWTKPDQDPSILYDKISFIKYFKPLNWYFGTGEYLDDAKKSVQKDVLNWLSNLRFGTEGYFFGSTYQGGTLFSRGKIGTSSSNIWELTDPNGVKIIQEQIKIAKNPDGGFVHYSWNKLNVKDLSPKVSFVRGIPEWGWVIGAGVYLDTIEDTISKNQTALISGLKKRIARSMMILAVLLCLIYFWAKRISNQIQKSVDTFSSFLEKARTDSIIIDPDDIQLKEFKDIAISTNKMLEDKRKANDTLKNNEKKYRNLLNTIPYGIQFADLEGKITYSNPAHHKIKGYVDGDLLGKYIWDLIADEEKKLATKEYYQSILKEQPHPIAYFNVDKTKDGRLIDTQINWDYIRDTKGEIEGIISITSDITEQRKTSEQLCKSEEKFRSAFHTSPDSINLTSLENGVYIEINAGFSNIMGYSREDIIGKSSIDINLWDDPKDRDRLVSELKKNGIIENLEAVFRRKDGQIIIGLISARLLTIENKDVILSITRDITERTQVEADRGRFLMAIEQSAEAIIITDVDGRIEYINPAFETITGYSEQEVFRQNPKILKSGEHDESFYHKMWKTITSGNTWKGRLINKKKNGTLYTEEATISPVFDKTGDVINFVAVKRDITDETRMEKQLQQSQRMEAIGTLAGGIAHDFNNILFPIVGHTEMLLEDAPVDGPLRDSLNEIYTSALRARDLVQQILAFSRQEKNELKLMKMQPIIKEALKMLRSTIPTTIEMTYHLDNDCGFIKADPTQFHQIVMNLATNAYHAMEDVGGKLEINLKNIELGEYDLINPDMPPGLYACLSVADTGKGMNKLVIEKIFDPFFTTKETGKGTGMGLSVVHGIVKRMKGAIQVNSQPGKGTEFYVYLPVVKSAFEKQSPKTNKPLQGGTERVLLIDDEEGIVTMEKLMLERLGYKVTSRTSSIEALEAFRDSPDKFNLVITDMAMPNMPGDKLSVELTKIRPDIPVLLCTGFSETMSEEKAASLGIKGFLLKPIVMKDLAQKIREVLD